MGEFIKLKEVKKENFMEFCSNTTYDTLITKKQSLNDKDNYRHQVKLWINKKVYIQTSITQPEYELIIAQRGEDSDKLLNYSFKTPARLVRGKRKDGSIYMMIDCLFSDDVRNSYFLNDKQVKLMQIYKDFNLPVIDKPETTLEELNEVIWPSLDND